MRGIFRNITVAAAGLALMTIGLPSVASAAEGTAPASEASVEQLIEEQMSAYEQVWKDHHPGQPALDIKDEIAIAPTDGGYKIAASPELESMLAKEMAASTFSRTKSVRGSERVTTYRLPEGLKLAIHEPLTAASVPNKPRGPSLVSGGRNSIGVYVIFSPLEQDLLIAGGGFALGTAICLIPVVGWSLCAVIGLVITVATVFISNYGKCKSTRPRLKVYPFVPERNACIR